MGSTEEVSLRVGEGRISGSIVFIEQVFPHRREQKILRKEWRLDFVYYVFNHLTQYWGHRLMHENKRLWNFHAVHHCPEKMDWLIHSNTSIPFGPLAYLIATPHFHHWHHAADAEAIDRNYAANLPVLDMIFGTWIGNHGRWPERYGVVGKPLPEGFIAQHLYPFIGRPKGEPVR
jgi:sterol desaturase/sphingolipid hydroxylase (fatty acid hydroxylase superfamily)